jgi:hypothetical protein
MQRSFMPVCQVNKTMRPRIILPLILAIVFVCVACRKDKDVLSDCEQLKAAITSTDKEIVRKEINALISQLPARQHTAENLAKLVSSIGQQCQVNATVLCYACIKTLPEQSEIRISVVAGAQSTSKTIDITSNEGGNMTFVNIHE